MSDADLAPLPHPARGRALYVYYRVRPGQQVAARISIETMQATLRPLQPGLQARLMCRVEDQPEEPTWMEVYEHPEGVSHACETMLDALASALPDDVFGPRHVEIFAPVDAP